MLQTAYDSLKFIFFTLNSQNEHKKAMNYGKI